MEEPSGRVVATLSLPLMAILLVLDQRVSLLVRLCKQLGQDRIGLGLEMLQVVKRSSLFGFLRE